MIFYFLPEPNIHEGPVYEQISTLYQYTVSEEAYISLFLKLPMIRHKGYEVSMVDLSNNKVSDLFSGNEISMVDLLSNKVSAL